MTATESSGPTPPPTSARASEFERLSSSPKVSSPSSSINATSSGRRAAEEAIPAAGDAPQRRSARPTASSSWGGIGLMMPASTRRLEVRRQVGERCPSWPDLHLPASPVRPAAPRSSDRPCPVVIAGAYSLSPIDVIVRLEGRDGDRGDPLLAPDRPEALVGGRLDRDRRADGGAQRSSIALAMRADRRAARRSPSHRR